MVVSSSWLPHVVGCPRAHWWCRWCLVLWCVVLVGGWLLGVPLLCRGVPVAVGVWPGRVLSRVVRALTGWGLSVGVRVRLRPGVCGCPAQTMGPGTTKASPPQQGRGSLYTVV